MGIDISMGKNKNKNVKVDHTPQPAVSGMCFGGIEQFDPPTVESLELENRRLRTELKITVAVFEQVIRIISGKSDY